MLEWFTNVSLPLNRSFYMNLCIGRPRVNQLHNYAVIVFKDVPLQPDFALLCLRRFRSYLGDIQAISLRNSTLQDWMRRL